MTTNLRRRDLERIAEEAFAAFDSRGVRGAGKRRFAARVGTVEVTLEFVLVQSDFYDSFHAACTAPVTLDESQVVIGLRPLDGLSGAGDAFDRLFESEIAPKRIAHSILGPKTRKRLVALHPCTLKLDERVLMLEVTTGRVSDVKRIRKMLRTVASIAERLPRALAARETLDGAHEPDEESDEESDEDAGYRGPSPEKSRAASEERAHAALRAEHAEVAALVRTRRSREFRRALRRLAVLVLIAVTFALLIIFGRRR